MKIDHKDKKEQRKFGILIGIIIVLIGTARWIFHGFGPIPVYWWSVGGLLLAVGIVVPKFLQPFFYVWIKFAEVLNWVVTHLLLVVVFYLVITPIGILYRIFKEDPLHREWLPAKETYWEEVEVQPTQLEEFRRQF